MARRGTSTGGTALITVVALLAAFAAMAFASRALAAKATKSVPVTGVNIPTSTMKPIPSVTLSQPTKRGKSIG